MAGGTKRFLVPAHRALRPIQRELYNDDRDAARELAIHTAATNSHAGPSAPRGPWVGAPSVSGKVIKKDINGGTFNPVGGSHFL